MSFSIEVDWMVAACLKPVLPARRAGCPFLLSLLPASSSIQSYVPATSWTPYRISDDKLSENLKVILCMAHPVLYRGLCSLAQLDIPKPKLRSKVSFLLPFYHSTSASSMAVSSSGPVSRVEPSCINIVSAGSVDMGPT